MFDLLLTNGTIATDYGVFKGSLAIRDGKIAHIISGESQVELDAKEVVDCTGKILMPGVIDSHVHTWEPGKNHRDDWENSTLAAICGGVTTILEHPLSIPAVKDEESFDLKYQVANKTSHTDFGLWGAILPNNHEHIERLQELGCVAFKGFISYANDEFPHLPDSKLYESMQLLKELDAITAVHAENADMAYEGAEKMKRMGRKDPLAHLESRESIVELESINKAILFSEYLKARLHIVHMSIHEGAELIKKAKMRGVPVTVETCPHFLASDVSLLEEKGPFALCTPPLRRKDNVEKLWDYIFDGTIDFIASDHSCYSKEEKSKGIDNIFNAEPGMPGLETMVPIMVDAAINKRNLSLTRFVELMSTNVAKVFNIYPRKGTILPGSDADITIIDLNEKWTVRDKDLHYKCGWSPYDGLELTGKVYSTIIRGKVVYKDNEVYGEPGYGEYITPIKLTE